MEYGNVRWTKFFIQVFYHLVTKFFSLIGYYDLGDPTMHKKGIYLYCRDKKIGRKFCLCNMI